MSKEYIVNVGEDAENYPWDEKFNFEIIKGQELIRCKYCRFYEDPEHRRFQVCTRTAAMTAVGETDFCSKAIRRENDGLL